MVGNCPQSTEMFVTVTFQFQTLTNPVRGPCDTLGHWWHEVILRPAKSNAKSLFTCQNLAPTFGRVSNWEKFPN
jgi:hypothetical protein